MSLVCTTYDRASSNCTFPACRRPLPREGAKQFFGMFFAAFPDIHHSLEDVLTDGHKVAIRMTIRGTQ
jgi:predicted ester cyclase